MRHKPFKQRKTYSIDIEAMAGRSRHYDHLGVPGIDPLAAVIDLVSRTSCETFDRERRCWGCDNWGTGDKLERLKRPGAIEPEETCSGCRLAYLDLLPGSSIDKLRDKLFERWIKAQDRARRANLAKRDALEPKDKLRAKRDCEEATVALQIASADCQAAGFSPYKQRGRVTKTLPDETDTMPRAGLVGPQKPGYS